MEPLEEQFRDLYPDHGVFSAVQEEFEARVRELEEEQRRLETEGRELTRGFQEEERSLRTGLQASIRAKEELMEQLRRQLDELYRNGSTTMDSLYREMDRIHEQFAGVSQSSPGTGAFQRQLEVIDTQIALSEAHLQAQINELEEQLRVHEQELHRLYQSIEEQVSAVTQDEEAVRFSSRPSSKGVIYGTEEERSGQWVDGTEVAHVDCVGRRPCRGRGGDQRDGESASGPGRPLGLDGRPGTHAVHRNGRGRPPPVGVTLALIVD